MQLINGNMVSLIKQLENYIGCTSHTVLTAPICMCVGELPMKLRKSFQNGS